MDHMLLYFSVSLRCQKDFSPTTQPLFWHICTVGTASLFGFASIDSYWGAPTKFRAQCHTLVVPWLCTRRNCKNKSNKQNNKYAVRICDKWYKKNTEPA